MKLSEGTQGEIDSIISSSIIGSVNIASSDFKTYGVYLNYSKFEDMNLPQNRQKFGQSTALSLVPRKNFCGVLMGSDHTNNAIEDPDDEASMN